MPKMRRIAAESLEKTVIARFIVVYGGIGSWRTEE
jgi:hypothetical protein